MSIHFHSCTVLISFKIVVIFNTTSAEIKTQSADAILKKATILKEMRIAQLCSKKERTLWDFLKKFGLIRKLEL